MPRSASPAGLLAQVNNEELAGVIAHELGHVRNRDTLTMTITAVIAGAIGMLANFAFFMGGARNNPLGLVGMLLVTMLAPFAAMLVQAAISRSREFEADRAGAELTGRPLWLANALARDRHAARAASTTRPPTPIPPRRICSSSIRCMAACAGCSPAILRPRTHRAAARHGGRTSAPASRALGVSLSEAPGDRAGLPARKAALALLSGVLRKRRPLDAQLDSSEKSCRRAMPVLPAPWPARRCAISASWMR